MNRAAANAGARAATIAIATAVFVVAAAGCPHEPPQHAHFIDAGAGDVVNVVQQQAVQTVAARRTLLVYVGAPWCEPCRRFHDAAAQGDLDAILGRVDLLTFNLDVDRDRLAAAGYASPMIPLLAVPGDDGRGTEKRMAGSIKGAGAVAEMTPRLQALLAP